MKSIVFVLLINATAILQCMAQPSLQKLQSSLSKPGSKSKVIVNTKINTQATITIGNSENVTVDNVPQWLSAKMNLRAGVDEFRFTGKKLKTKDNWYIHYLQQFYKGVPLQYGMASVLSYAGKAQLIQLEFFPVAESMEVTPTLSAATAFDKAKLYVNAEKYVWENYTGTDSDLLPPIPKLTIVENPKLKGEMELCYKLRIAAVKPMKYMDIFVNAMNGSVEMVNNLQHEHKVTQNIETNQDTLKYIYFPSAKSGQYLNTQRVVEHSNASVPATGNTRYSGFKSDLQTDDASGVEGQPYRLRSVGDPLKPDILTYNYEGRTMEDVLTNNTLATDFLDNDNAWTEYNDVNKYTPHPTLSGVDVHFNMQVIRDYWNDIHYRSGWNNDNGSAFKSFVHAVPLTSSNTPQPGQAVWSSLVKAMYFGDGDYSAANAESRTAYTSLDICAHEIGHGVCRSLAGNGDGLSNTGEPAAINEGLSDIWGACAEKFYNERYTLDPQKNIWVIGEEISPLGSPIRNLQSPLSVKDPAFYQGRYWDSNDEEHKNSSVLTKWFYIITEGEENTNERGLSYSIQGIGFEKSQRLVYLTEGQLPTNADYFTFRNIAIATAQSLLGNDIEHNFTEEDIKNVKRAWAAVGLGNIVDVYDMDNQQGIFSTNDFQSIVVGKDGYVWAGTNQQGLYKYNGAYWEKSTGPVSGYNINDIKADKSGGVWVAESGTETTYNAGGGVYYFADTVFGNGSFQFYSVSRGLTTRDVQSIFIDTAYNNAGLKRVWLANMPHTDVNGEGQTTVKGGISYGLNPDNTFNSRAADIASEAGALVVGGDKNEVWAFVRNNGSPLGPNELLRYDANTAAYLGSYNATNVSELPLGFEVQAIYTDPTGYRFIGLNNGKGVRVRRPDGTWVVVNFPSIFPGNCIVQKNAITGDRKNNVYIGTDSGLVIFNGTEIDRELNYTRLTTGDFLPSNKITGVCFDTIRGGLWLATDAGVAFLNVKGERRVSVSIPASAPGDLCGENFAVSVTVDGNYYNTPSPNKFIVELSDKDGNFSNPVLLGEVTDAPINARFQSYQLPPFKLPPNMPYSATYNVRVRSVNPALSSVTQWSYAQGIVPVTPNTSFTANRECTDQQGWTHYFDNAGTPDFFDDILLLSIKKNGNNIGTLGVNGFGVKVYTTANAGTGSGTQVVSPFVSTPFFSINRYWNVVNAVQPAGNVGVRFYYRLQDFADVNGNTPQQTVKHEDLVFYKAIGGDPNPVSNFAGCTGVICMVHERPDFTLPNLTWKHTDMGYENHVAEFQVNGFSGGSGGITLGGGAFNNDFAVSIMNGNWSDPATWSTHLVPDQNTAVFVNHVVTVDINAECKTLKASTPGEVKVLTGKDLKVFK